MTTTACPAKLTSSPAWKTCWKNFFRHFHYGPNPFRQCGCKFLLQYWIATSLKCQNSVATKMSKKKASTRYWQADSYERNPHPLIHVFLEWNHILTSGIICPKTKFCIKNHEDCRFMNWWSLSTSLQQFQPTMTFFLQVPACIHHWFISHKTPKEERTHDY